MPPSDVAALFESIRLNFGSNHRQRASVDDEDITEGREEGTICRGSKL
jgi:hypothetical protein